MAVISVLKSCLYLEGTVKYYVAAILKNIELSDLVLVVSNTVIGAKG